MENGAKSKDEKEHVYTREEVSSFLQELAVNSLEREGLYLHGLVALNHLLSLPNVNEVFDEELKVQARELWRKLKANSLELVDPPFLFGAASPKADA